MRVISRSRLKSFWETPGHDNSEQPLLAWHRVVSDQGVSWTCFADVREMYEDASIFEDCVIFNIKGNAYRLITRMRYQAHKVYIVDVLTHRDSDKNQWKQKCRCADKRIAQKKHSAKSGKQTGGRQ